MIKDFKEWIPLMVRVSGGSLLSKKKLSSNWAATIKSKNIHRQYLKTKKKTYHIYLSVQTSVMPGNKQRLHASYCQNMYMYL